MTGTDASSVSLGGETVKATLAKFTMAAIGFVGTIVFARVLGPTGFGGYYLLFSLVKLVDRAVSGWGSATKKRYSEATTDGDEILGGQLAFTVVWVGLSGIGLLIGSNWLVGYTGLPEAPVMFAVLLVAVTLYEPTEQVVQARGLIGAATWIDAFRSALTFPLQLAFVLLGFGAAGMAYGLAIATLLAVPVLWRFIDCRPRVPSRDTLQSLWSYARYSIPNSFLGQAYDRFDVLLLGFLLAPAVAGYYEVAFKLTLPAAFVMMSAASGLMARVSNKHSRNEPFAEDVSNTLSFSSVLAVPMVFGAFVLSEPLVVTLYGPEYAPAAAFVVGLAVYQLLTTQRGPLSRTIDAVDRPDVNTVLSMLALGVNVVLGIVLTLEFGGIGVVVATVIAESIRYGVSAAYVRRILPEVTLLPRTLLEQVGAAAVMVLVVLLLREVVPIQRWYHLLAVVAAGALVYGAVLLAGSRKLRVTIEGVVRESGLGP
ncbi:lipopolysaccharide biosynthesis protein [Halalkalicoccus jeotgali]|uniref:Polysaccharide biosynthesis protein n=1 Tax=Halalkalicoccus jeotgali (strain DSM 18796 / CECT 7217 / JCM 14584 / KCTC 4019 / B3) TaxID=795797 RepID=D8J4N6_HALJB|nr:oligosaccharide flippase family protein [Halalkalicoccus jeotgali]ADJ15503.1 polysaccharide biosynthesis protein [Halalkalicoccus jeotgali B3]ELY36088.1 polysaccharide biosynthesis protein [Halalkalicoccus jeotgali B3]